VSAVSGTPGWSTSVRTALLWASGCAALGGEDRTVSSNELFLGLLLAHPDPRGEVWQLLDHFGLTARDLLPDDYRVIDGIALHEAAAAARGPDQADWDAEVSSILTDASIRGSGTAQVLHVMAELLTRTPWPERLQFGLARFGISASDLVRELNSVVPSLDGADTESADDAPEKIKLRSSTTAGEQIGQWLSRRFPRRPATMASFSNDAPDPGADFIGVSEEADAFAYLIASRKLVPPLAIGLFGNWGSGKSFLMAKIRQRVSQLTTLAATDGDSTVKEVWTKVVPIEFNAWQYVETDLWAALLSRIFDELSPEARRKLTELSRRQQVLRAREDENLREQMRAESAVADLLEQEESQAQEVQKAAEGVEDAKQQVTALRDIAVRGALDAHARSAATAVLAAGIGTVLAPQVGEAVKEAHRLEAAAEAPVWRQSKFWSPSRIAWVSLAVLVVPLLVVILDLRGFKLPTALTAALGTCAALLVPVLRAAANFAEGQQKAAFDAAEKVEQELSSLVEQAEDKRTAKESEVEATRSQIEAERQKAAQAAAKRVDLDSMAARLNARTVYADFLSGRNTSDDYRKRLGIVTTVSDDLEALSSLIGDYNDSPEGQQLDGPPNRIVLYIDDLDRCPPARVVEVLEAIYLLLAFPLFVVVVAVDTRWLTAALHSALPILEKEAAPGVAAPTATDYLEKIFQIPFWVEPLDDGGRQRLLRGLLLPSVAESNGARPPQAGTALRVGRQEQEAAGKMLAAHGPWLDRDAQKFTITGAELAFIEALTPLVAGTPRQVKRFVNICKLLLAMSPPLAGGDGLATERTTACFMAAVNQSMWPFAMQLAAAAASSKPGPTLETILSDLMDPKFADDRQRVQDWLAKQSPPPPPAVPFGSADASMLIKRWDVIRRLRFAENELNELATPTSAEKASDTP
jgi:KAP family P-loop domain